MATWLDIKKRSLQKMFSTEGDSIPQTTATRDYLAAMPGACNEALQLLSTAGKFVIKSIEIAHNPVKNLLVKGEYIDSIERGTMTFEAKSARSCYFEYFGACTYDISVDGVEFVSGELSSTTNYTPFKRLIDNPNDKEVKITLTSDYPLAVKNVAMYSASFPSNEAVQSYAEKIKYDMRKLAPDFYALTNDAIIFEGGKDVARYIQSSDFFKEGNKVLVLDRNQAGNYTVYYKAYPVEITSETSDDYELPIDPEVAALIPLYIASELYKEDDISIATQCRNAFEVGREALMDAQPAPSSERFVDESGWI